ncbi:DUF1028 domain-containing protein [Halorussus salinisoli]|uniref:DUF1028 domain-containing protein n=1 Tax=Halorussus salinisoli TaxID=2558242 RepID=UPI0010C1AB41|nr:DUF1028 domain-containing protein [Halorussus salinisoli]
MTFSICARESYLDDEEREQIRYGVAVVTRLPRVGALCPFANQSGAVSTQSRLNVELGRKGVAYLADGLRVGDALPALLNADPNASHRQLHGVDQESAFAHTGEDCDGWAGHLVGENYSIAGNLLRSEAVVKSMEKAYVDGERDDGFAQRLLAVLRAGEEVGGDARDELSIQSGAILIRDTEDYPIMEPASHDVRIDATTTPVDDLQETLDAVITAHQEALKSLREKYARLA